MSGDIDMDVTPEMRLALDTAVAAHPKVVVDLTHARLIDSVGLGVLVRARNAARARHGELLLAGPSRFIQTVLRTMRLHTAFRMFDTVGHAVAAGGPVRPAAPDLAGYRGDGPVNHVHLCN